MRYEVLPKSLVLLLMCLSTANAQAPVAPAASSPVDPKAAEAKAAEEKAAAAEKARVEKAKLLEKPLSDVAADGTLVAREVFVGFANGPMLNERTSFPTTLPPTMMSTRGATKKIEEAKPQPTGLITFEGATQDNVDVLLEYDNSARVVARWPHTEVRSTRTLWRKWKLEATTTSTSNVFPSASWVNRLRESDRLVFRSEGKAEKFLLYDLSVKLSNLVELEVSENGYVIKNLGQHPIHDVCAYRPMGDGKYRRAYIPTVPGVGAASAAPPPGAVAAAPVVVAEGAAVPMVAIAPAAGVAAPARVAIAAVPLAPAQPVAAPAGTPSEGPAPSQTPPAEAQAPVATPPKHELTWVTEAETVEQHLAEWRERLTKLDLGNVEVEHAVGILKEYAFEADEIRVTFRLDPAAVEASAPLDISPVPQRVTRVWLTVIDGIDPEIRLRARSMIDQLGDASYAKRMEAQLALKKFGPTIAPILNEAKSRPDLEIVRLVEELLEEITP